jgi:hypothetical protein
VLEREEEVARAGDRRLHIGQVRVNPAKTWHRCWHLLLLWNHGVSKIRTLNWNTEIWMNVPVLCASKCYAAN